MASSIPTARANLVAGLTALTVPAAALEGVAVFRTGLWRDVARHDRIIVLNARDITRQIAALSTQTPIREAYALEVAVEIYRQGDDIEAVEERLWDVITEVERYVLANKTLGGAVNQALPAGVQERAGPAEQDEDTLIALATLRVDCWARVLLS